MFMFVFDIIRKKVRSEKFKFRITWRSQYRSIFNIPAGILNRPVVGISLYLL